MRDHNIVADVRQHLAEDGGPIIGGCGVIWASLGPGRWLAIFPHKRSAVEPARFSRHMANRTYNGDLVVAAHDVVEREGLAFVRHESREGLEARQEALRVDVQLHPGE